MKMLAIIWSIIILPISLPCTYVIRNNYALTARIGTLGLLTRFHLVRALPEGSPDKAMLTDLDVPEVKFTDLSNDTQDIFWAEYDELRLKRP